MAKTRAALIAWLCLAAPAFAAQNPSDDAQNARPAWSELAPEHQKVLAPLAREWSQLDSKRRT